MKIKLPYVTNKLQITGDPIQMEKLFTESNGMINFGAAFPLPKALTEEETHFFRIMLWGTSGIINPLDDTLQDIGPEYNVKRDRKGQIRSLKTTFITEHISPMTYFMKLQDLYPKLKFKLECIDKSNNKGFCCTRYRKGIPFFDIQTYYLMNNPKYKNDFKWLRFLPQFLQLPICKFQQKVSINYYELLYAYLKMRIKYRKPILKIILFPIFKILYCIYKIRKRFNQK